MSSNPFLILAAGEAPAFVTEIAYIILAGALVAYVGFRFLKVRPIVGFLLAGVLIGPNALGLVTDRAIVDACAEIGVILLLFTIGIEFSLDKLAAMKNLIFGGGTVQVGLTTAIVTGILMTLGITWQAAVFTGFLVALSSTAIVLKLLAARAETESPHGKIGLGFLIFQDLMIVPMVLLVPMLAGTGGSATDIALALGKAAGLIVVVLIVARKLMPKVLELVAKTCSPEIFLLSLVAICIGTAYLTSLAGVSLSLGAFLAGLVVSESRFSEHALGEIMPLQILFSAAFFISVGMLLDVRFLVDNILLVLGAIAVVLVIKIFTTGIAALAAGQSVAAAGASSLLLAQVGEFSFVLERAGREVGLSPGGLDEQGGQIFIATTVVLMVATPMLAAAGAGLGEKIKKKRAKGSKKKASAADVAPEVPYLSNHVIVAGYGHAGHQLVRLLHGSTIPFLIITLNPPAANEAEADGLPVMRGDASRLHTLQHAGIERAKMLLIVDDDPATTRRIAMVGRSASPTVRIITRTRWTSEIEPMMEEGVDRVIAEELESVLAVFSAVLHNFQLPAEEILADEQLIREGGYQALRAVVDRLQPIIRCDLDPDCLDTRLVRIREGAPAAGKRIDELELGTLKIRALRRGGKTLGEPGAELELIPGDDLLLAGDSDAFQRETAVFRSMASPLPPPSGRRKVDTSRTIILETDVDDPHLDMVQPVRPSATGCQECLAMGHDDWVHLRICMTCGHVGCCDDSPGKHASAHFHATGHPIMRSIEPGETWGWCFIDEQEL
ncbi:MAG: cation:proton antiporter [Acidobacteriota bacterium]